MIFGLGHVAGSYNSAEERIFECHVVGQGKWLMRHGADVLFEAEFGQPKLRRERMEKARFVDMIVLASEDGVIDVLPRLRPRISSLDY